MYIPKGKYCKIRRDQAAFDRVKMKHKNVFELLYLEAEAQNFSVLENSADKSLFEDLFVIKILPCFISGLQVISDAEVDGISGKVKLVTHMIILLDNKNGEAHNFYCYFFKTSSDDEYLIFLESSETKILTTPISADEIKIKGLRGIAKNNTLSLYTNCFTWAFRGWLMIVLVSFITLLIVCLLWVIAAKKGLLSSIGLSKNKKKIDEEPLEL